MPSFLPLDRVLTVVMRTFSSVCGDWGWNRVEELSVRTSLYKPSPVSS